MRNRSSYVRVLVALLLLVTLPACGTRTFAMSSLGPATRSIEPALSHDGRGPWPREEMEVMDMFVSTRDFDRMSSRVTSMSLEAINCADGARGRAIGHLGTVEPTTKDGVAGLRLRFRLYPYLSVDDWGFVYPCLLAISRGFYGMPDVRSNTVDNPRSNVPANSSPIP